MDAAPTTTGQRMAQAGWFTAGLLAVLCVRFAAAADPVPVSELTGLVEQWVALQRDIREETLRWQDEQQALEQTRELLRRERAALEEHLARLDDQQDRFDRERAESEQRRQEQEKSLRDAERIAQDHRRRLEGLHAQWPPPAQETLEEAHAAVRRSANRARHEKIQAILAYYAEAQRLQREVRAETRLMSLGGDDPRQYDVLSVGLSTAYAVSRDQSVAGYLHWNGDAWVWTRDDSLALAIRDAVRVSRTEIPPRFISLPVKTP